MNMHCYNYRTLYVNICLFLFLNSLMIFHQWIKHILWCYNMYFSLFDLLIIQLRIACSNDILHVLSESLGHTYSSRRLCNRDRETEINHSSYTHQRPHNSRSRRDALLSFTFTLTLSKLIKLSC